MKSGTSLLVAALLLVAVVGTAVAGGLALGLIPPFGEGATTAPTTSPTAAAPATATPASPSPASPSPASPSPTTEPSPTGTPAQTAAPTPGGTYVVQEGDTLFGIGELFGVPWELIAQANDLEDPYYIYPEQELVIPAPSGADSCQRSYVIQPGDTFYDIAYELDVSPDELAQVNGITDINTIAAGDVLIVPGGDDCPSPSPSSPSPSP